MFDLQVLLEIASKLNLMADAKKFNNIHKLKNRIKHGLSQINFTAVFKYMIRSTRLRSVSVDHTRFALCLMSGDEERTNKYLSIKEIRRLTILGILADRRINFLEPKLKFFLRQQSKFGARKK